MTRLELAERLWQKAGIAGSGPTSTVGQMGEASQIVNWIDEAYEYLQNEVASWLYLRGDFSFNTVASTFEYDTSTIASDYAELKQDTLRIYKTASGTSDEQWLDFVRWRDFRDAYMLASQRTETGRPTYYTIMPDLGIRLYPGPDDIYTVTGEYYKVPDVMTADSDEPIIPERFQMAIVWKGLEFYGSYHEEPNRESKGEEQYNKILNRIMSNQIPKISFGKPLA